MLRFLAILQLQSRYPVDMQNGKLVFRKASTPAPAPDAGREPSPAERNGSLDNVFGALKDTVTIAPGTNLTDPIDEDWNAARPESAP